MVCVIPFADLSHNEMTQEDAHAPLLCHFHLQKISRLIFLPDAGNGIMAAVFVQKPFGDYQNVYFLIVPSATEIDSAAYKI